jgi:hypothetical protein
MFFVCECGEKFNEDQDGAREHVLEQHLDLVETRYDEFINDFELFSEAETDEEIYDIAIDDVQDELLDAFEEG